MRSQDALRVTRQGRALHLVFTRPSRLNAVTADCLDDLADLLEETAEDPEIRVVTVTGEGRAFCAGADLGTPDVVDGPGDAPGTETILAANRVARALKSMPQCVVAAVNGSAVGVGVSIALACDLVLAAQSAYFLLVFTDIGLMPDGGATVLVPASLGRSRALQMALAPDRVSAARAAEWGLVYRAVPDAELPEALDTLVLRLAETSPRAVAATKAAVNAATLGSLDEGLDRELRDQALLLRTDEFRAAVAAFGAKRGAAR